MILQHLLQIKLKKLNNTSTLTKPEPTIYLNDKEISKDEMEKINPKSIKSIDIKKEKSNLKIRMVSNIINLVEDAEILLNKKVISYEDLNKLDKNEIESINIKNLHLVTHCLLTDTNIVN